VRLSNASYQPISVSYATADGTATAGSDYVAGAGTLNFNPGETVKVFTVQIKGDTQVEANEIFFIRDGEGGGLLCGPPLFLIYLGPSRHGAGQGYWSD
jgi:Calx-beta domain